MEREARVPGMEGKTVTVMGIGLHGGALAMIDWLLGRGAHVIATDTKTDEELAPSLKLLRGLKNLTVVTGRHRIEDFKDVDMVIINPAVRWDNQYIRAALDNGVPVEMDAGLFFRTCPSKNVIGVTGTKGKTTTSLLLYEIIVSSGRKAVKVGIGQEAVMNKLSEINPETFVVFELSSWRLGALARAGISPHIAVVTNIYQDHLNYYGSMSEYVADKQAIFRHHVNSDFLILNLDNENVTQTPVGALASKSRRLYFSMNGGKRACVFIESGAIGYRLEGREGRICRLDEVGMRGDHNLGNVLAACTVAVLLGLDPEKIREAVLRFRGAPHRLELVKELNGVKFYNDTAATTPESGLAGIGSFSEDLFLIAGGSNKNLDLNAFAEGIAGADTIKGLFLLDGAATRDLKDLVERFGGASKIVGVYPDMGSAVSAAYGRCRDMTVPGSCRGVILLSPGCASFGMFQNEFDRGDKFKAAVHEIVSEG